jgi:predicted DNA-binding ribbon-helix-helix protein
MRQKAKSRRHRELIRGTVLVSGRRTTISLEPIMWDALRDIAAEQGKIVNQLVTEISRQDTVNLSGSIRVYIVEYYRAAQRVGANRPTRESEVQITAFPRAGH